MKIVNIDLTNPNWREEAKKINQYPIEFTLIDNLEEDTNKLNLNISKNRKYNPVTHRHEYTGKPKYISSMSGGLEHKLYNILAKVYAKIIIKLSKYKKNIFE
tara:strand:+ start:81 stop:386 length:306 start_codon:yes stop_codon:yes gene_type:complete